MALLSVQDHMPLAEDCKFCFSFRILVFFWLLLLVATSLSNLFHLLRVFSVALALPVRSLNLLCKGGMLMATFVVTMAMKEWFIQTGGLFLSTHTNIEVYF
jgi:hypothetical protein